MEDYYGDILVVKGVKGHSQSIPILLSPFLFESEKRLTATHPKLLKPYEDKDDIVFIKND